ncbi:hypothetical protein DFJ74DRAFT_683339 [Hyaloraphidium curvatum]|nr:hypothetical protein DFJ74DRAFT_683339 [Hyaloraphidium curvatum]
MIPASLFVSIRRVRVPRIAALVRWFQTRSPVNSAASSERRMNQTSESSSCSSNSAAPGCPEPADASPGDGGAVGAQSQRNARREKDARHRLVNKRDHVKAKLDLLHRQEKEQETELRLLDAELEGLEAEASTAAARLLALEKQLAAKNAAEDQYKERADELERRLGAAALRKSELAAETSRLRAGVQVAVQATQRLSHDLQREQMRYRAQLDVLRTRKERMKELEERLAVVKASIQSQGEAYERASTALERCKNSEIMEHEEARIAKTRLKLVRNEAGTLKTALEDLDRQAVLAKHRLEDLETVRALKTAELDDLGLQIRSQRDELSSAETRVRDAESVLDERIVSRADMERRRMTAESQLLDVQRRKDESIASLREVEFMKDRLDERLDELRGKVMLVKEEQRRLQALEAIVGNGPESWPTVGALSSSTKGTSSGTISGLRELLALKIKELDDLKSANAKLANRLETNKAIGEAAVRGRPVNHLSGKDLPKEVLREQVQSLKKKLLDLRSRKRVASEETEQGDVAERSPTLSRPGRRTRSLSSSPAFRQPRMDPSELAVMAELQIS